MRTLRNWACIIGLLGLAALLQGCSAVRLGYNNAPQLAYWWLDGYFDFDSRQSQTVRAELQTALAWHRSQELPLLEQQLIRLQGLSQANITPAQVCSVYGDLQSRAIALVEPLTDAMAATATSLSEAQLQYLDQAFEKKDREWREEWLEGSPAERAERRMKRAVEWAEWFYGRLSPEQLALLEARFQASQFDPALQHREKLRRHQDLVATLRAIRGQATAPAQQALRALLARTVVSADIAYRRHLDQLVQENCVTVAALHNSSSPRQRARLQRTLRDYQGDAQALSEKPT